MERRTERTEQGRTPERLAVLAAAISALALAGCQSFQPAEPAGLRPGQTVRVELADSAARARADWNGPDRDRLTGELVRSSADGMELSIRSRVGGSNLSPYRDTLDVPASLISSVQRQRISALRSAAVAGGVVAAAAILFELEITGGGTVAPPNGGGATESIGISIPLFP